MTRFLRLLLDIPLLVLLPFTVCYMYTEWRLHECLGTAMCVGVVLHHVINRRWFLSLGKGKYNLARVLTTVVDMLLLVDVVLLLVSGVCISLYVFAWTNLCDLHLPAMQQLHLCAGYWALVLMGLHLGQHMPQMLGMMRLTRLHKAVRRGFLLLFVLMAGFGVCAFVQEDIPHYLVPGELFSLTESTPGFFLAEITCMMVAWALAGCYLQKLAAKASR